MIFKKKVNLWVFDLYEDSSFVYGYNKKENQPYDSKKYEDLLDGFFITHFTNHYKFKIKRFGKDILNPNEYNLTVLPVDTSEFFVYLLENFPHDVYDICCKHNIKFIISYIREIIQPIDETKIFENAFKKGFLYKNQNYSNLKIFLNGYEDIKYSKYKDVFFTIDVFDHLMRTYLNGFIKPKSNFKVLKKSFFKKNKKKYNFSLFIGLLEGREHRQSFLANSFKQNIIDDNLFYNAVFFDQTTFMKEFYKFNSILTYKEANDIIEKIFNTKLYDFNGKEFDKKKLYDEHLEYQIPYQMIDSYVNIVLETRIDCPSITEKLYKPIIAEVPFVWYGYHGILKYLESKGYKKYPFIDYAFDSIEDHVMRESVLINEIKRLNGLDLKKEVFSCRNISKHNKKMFYKNTNKFERFEDYLNGQF